MTRKILRGHDRSKAIGRFTDSGIEFNDGLTPQNFRTLAFAVAGPHWRTRLGPMIGRNRGAVWEYAEGKRKVPKPVAKLMVMLAKDIGS